MAMASAAAISTTLLKRPPLVVHPAMAASASPTMMLRRRPRSSLTTTCAAVDQTLGQGAVRRRPRGACWTRAPVSSIGPANEDQTIFLITLDLSGAPDLVDAYTTPGQYLLTRVHSPEKPPLRPAYMCISSAPRSGHHFDLLVRCVPGTTSEQLCKLHVGDHVELGPVKGKGFAIQHINPPPVAENVFLFAYTEGISPIRALIEHGFRVPERADVTLFFADKDRQSMPYQERFNRWEQSGVKVKPLTQPIDEPFLEHNVHIVDPQSTGAIIVGPAKMREEVTGYLLDYDVPDEKILTIEWDPTDPFKNV